MHELVALDRGFVVWWATSVEVFSGLHRRMRAGEIDVTRLELAERRVARLMNYAAVIPPSDPVRDRAHRLLAVHALRAADALQLAAALVWGEERPAGLALVTLDSRLGEAANREGFRVLP
jgi:hypothetical protein